MTCGTYNCPRGLPKVSVQHCVHAARLQSPKPGAGNGAVTVSPRPRPGGTASSSTANGVFRDWPVHLSPCNDQPISGHPAPWGRRSSSCPESPVRGGSAFSRRTNRDMGPVQLSLGLPKVDPARFGQLPLPQPRSSPTRLACAAARGPACVLPGAGGTAPRNRHRRRCPGRKPLATRGLHKAGPTIST